MAMTKIMLGKTAARFGRPSSSALAHHPIDLAAGIASLDPAGETPLKLLTRSASAIHLDHAEFRHRIPALHQGLDAFIQVLGALPTLC